jgi:hypothetical protein
MARGAAFKESRKEGKVDAAGGGKSQVAVNLSRNPEVKGGGLASEKRGGRDQPTASPPTLGGECSG